MITLSTRTKNAIKTALAVVIAYGICLGMGWENPYWAGFAVAMISLSTAGLIGEKKLQKSYFGFWNADFGFKVFCLFKTTERSDSIISQSSFVIP